MYIYIYIYLYIYIYISFSLSLGKNASFERVPLGPYLGPNWSPMGQAGRKFDPNLATASHQAGPNGDTTWGTLLQTKHHR